MSGSSGEKLCPICDSPLQPGSRKCGFCGTDLSIFDNEVEKKEPVRQAAPAPRPTMESRVREVLSKPPPPRPEPAPEATPKPAPEPKPVETPVPAAPPTKPAAEVKIAPVVTPEAAPKASAETRPAAEPAAKEYFECPECGAMVETHATSCPGCGVMFAEEGTDMFQCPACNTLVSIDSETCPGCGAVFVESEPEPVPQSAQPPVEIEAPISEVKTPPPEEAVALIEPEPEPVQAPPSKPEPAPIEEPADKKGLGGFGWFKKRKKDSERAESMGPGIRDLALTPEEPERIPEPQLERPVPAPTPAPAPAPAAPPAPVRYRSEPAPTAPKDKGKELARMVAEMKPLLTLANEKDIDINESKRLIDEAADAGRNRQLDNALEFVNRSRDILMAKIDEHLASAVAQLKEETGVAKTLGGDVSRALTYIGETETARSTGDVEAAFAYADRVSSELLPITGRYKEARKRTTALRSLVADCETLILDTKEARVALAEASKAFEANDFERVEMLVKQATDRLYRAIPDRVNEEMHAAKAQLIEAKMRNVNTTPMITTLKSVRTLMKAGDYQQALREMKEFKEQMRKVT